LIALLGSDRKVMQKRVSGRISIALVWIATTRMTIAAQFLIVTLHDEVCRRVAPPSSSLLDIKTRLGEGSAKSAA
jgi:hypothetical protein